MVSQGKGRILKTSMPEIEGLSVADALRQSRVANLERLRAGNKRTANYSLAERFAATALELREYAHANDPEHTDPEWANDRVPHDQMVDFLRLYPQLP